MGRVYTFALLLLVIFVASIHSISSKNIFEKTLDSTSGSDVVFSAILTLRELSDGDRCGPLLEHQLQLLAALQWTVEQLNKDPDTNIGFQVYDDCGSELLALEAIQQIYGCRRSTIDNQCQNTDTSPADIGLIGLSLSLNNMPIINILRKYNIPVVSPVIHVTDSLSNNFRLTRPSFSSQAKVVVNLLKNLSWSYVATVHTDDVYGNIGVEVFKQQAAAEGICVEVIGHIPVEPMSSLSASLEEIIGRIQMSIRHAYGGNLAVVFYGFGAPGRKTVAKLKSVENITLILFDTLEESPGSLVNKNDIPANTIMVRNPNPVIGSFEAVFSEKVTNDSINGTDSLGLMVKQFYQETNRFPENITDSNRNYNVFSVIDAVLTLSEAYKLAKNDLCLTQNPTCNIRAEDVTSRLKDVSKDYTSVPFLSSQIPSSEYKIGNITGHDFSVCSTAFSKTKVMCGNETDVLAQLPVSHCKGVCSVCHHHQPYRYAYIEGEVLILGLFSVHEASSADVYSCGRFQSSFVQSIIPETFLYGVELIRRRTGIKFGALVMDSCQSPARVMLMVSKFMSGDLKLTKPGSSEVIDPKKVRFAVGAGFSEPTVALATLLTEFSLPLVSHSASTPDLDDRLSFPYFLRTVPSDVIQVSAMVQIIKRMQWQFVGLIYVDNNYGQKGKRAFLSKAKDEGVCVTDTPIALQTEGTANENLAALSRLRFQRANVVVLIVTESRLASFLGFLKNQCETSGVCDNFIFLASETWGNSQHLLEVGGDVILGSISLAVGTMRTADHTFYEHLLQRTPHSGLYNPWFNSAWMEIHQCSLNDTDINKQCPYDALFPSDIAKEWSDSQRTVHLINAVLAIGQGMANCRTSVCNGDETKFPCQYILNHPEVVIENVRSARLFKDGVEFGLFDDAGNGQTGYDIYHIHRSETDVQSGEYKKVGTFEEGKLVLDPDVIDYYRSDISAKCTDEICASCHHLSATHDAPPMTTVHPNVRWAEIVIIVIVGLICMVVIVNIIIVARERCANSTNPSKGDPRYRTKNLSTTTTTHKRNPATLSVIVEEPRNRRGPETPDKRSTYLNPGQVRLADSHIYSTTTDEGYEHI